LNYTHGSELFSFLFDYLQKIYYIAIYFDGLEKYKMSINFRKIYLCLKIFKDAGGKNNDNQN